MYMYVLCTVLESWTISGFFYLSDIVLRCGRTQNRRPAFVPGCVVVELLSYSPLSLFLPRSSLLFYFFSLYSTVSRFLSVLTCHGSLRDSASFSGSFSRPVWSFFGRDLVFVWRGPFPGVVIADRPPTAAHCTRRHL